MKPTFKTSLLKLALIGALFYTSYGLSNHYAASLAYVPEVAFAWERGIPFWAWTIVPYWSLNLMYAAAFFLCRNACEQNRYVARLVSAQIIATTCFMLFPLHFGWPKPPTDGLWDWLFDSLVAFDLPYNQAPSLHIALSIIVGAFYWTRFPKIRLPIFLWQSLIALSVLTTYQHHFIDVPTGALLGWLVLWAIPQHGVSPFRRPFNTQGRLKTSEASFCEAKTNAVSFARTSEASFREAKTPRNTFPRNQNCHAVSGGCGIVGSAVLVRQRVVVDVVGQRVAIGGRFRLFDRQRGGIPKTGRRQIVGSGNDFAAALSGGRAAEHGLLAEWQGEDGAGS